MKVTFEIPGEPVPKLRPKFVRNGNFVRAYTPSKTSKYETHCRKSYLQQIGNVKLTGEIAADFVFYYQIPKSTTKKMRTRMTSHEVMHLTKPDLDNAIKSVLDGIQGLAFQDDKQVCILHAEKYYDDNPRVEVTLRELHPEIN